MRVGTRHGLEWKRAIGVEYSRSLVNYLDEAAIRSCLLIAVLLWGLSFKHQPLVSSLFSDLDLDLWMLLGTLQAWNRLSTCRYHSCEGCGGG